MEFQSTHPHGVRHTMYQIVCDRCGVSIHAPTWGATNGQIVYCPPPFVSIHAPTWGATVQSDLDTYESAVSIHAPTWGATLHQKRLTSS